MDVEEYAMEHGISIEEAQKRLDEDPKEQNEQPRKRTRKVVDE
jgi:hypothetical protein